MIRVVVVDDEQLVRSVLRLILSSAGDIEVVADCGGGQAVPTVVAHRPDVVLLDIRMPDEDGLTVLRGLRTALAGRLPAVAMLTTFDADEYLGPALRLGATGFLLKDTEPEQLVRSVRVLAGGSSVLGPGVTRTVADHYTDPAPAGDRQAVRAVQSLTARERDVLALLGEGLSNLQAAERLGLAGSTVKDHVSVVLAKLGGVNRVQAAVIADRAGLVGRAHFGSTHLDRPHLDRPHLDRPHLGRPHLGRPNLGCGETG
ncbi:response regulator transcription factor [Streptomyces sp. NPDC051742]|uniref:response regulator transcription factor n=1 Tax=unclassified Streptomyces TaxID=2593676 RepID=UPI00343088E8